MNKKPWIIQASEAAGNKIFESGDYDLNIISVRKDKGTPDTFDDVMFVCYKINGLWQTESFQITTDPGVYHLNNPSRVEGTAILKAGQYLSVYKRGRHRGKYPALVQTGGRVVVWRDADRDEFLDFDKTQDGYFGINIHRAHATRELDNVGRYSAGCQVFQRADDLDRLLWLCRKQIDTHPAWSQTFSYTLIEESGLKKKRTKKKS